MIFLDQFGMETNWFGVTSVATITAIESKYLGNTEANKGNPVKTCKHFLSENYLKLKFCKPRTIYSTVSPPVTQFWKFWILEKSESKKLVFRTSFMKRPKFSITQKINRIFQQNQQFYHSIKQIISNYSEFPLSPSIKIHGKKLILKFTIIKIENR